MKGANILFMRLVKGSRVIITSAGGEVPASAVGQQGTIETTRDDGNYIVRMDTWCRPLTIVVGPLQLKESRAFWAEKQVENVAKRQAKVRAPSGVTCPTCHSSSVERVTLGVRAVSGVAGGFLFSKKARAQFHCRNCNYYW